MKGTKKALFDKLKAFYDDKDFIIGVISNAKTPVNFQRIIDFMDKEENVTIDNILALSILLDDETEKPITK